MTGDVAIKRLCLLRWLRKMEHDGPDYTAVQISDTKRAAALAVERHGERLTSMRQSIAELTQ